MILTFENSRGERRVLSNPSEIKEALNHISDFLKEHNFRSYYSRYTYDYENKEIMIDVGSHSEFFYIADVSKEDMDKFFDRKDKEIL